MRLVMVFVVALVACRPERVASPYDQHTRSAGPEVTHDVSGAAPAAMVHARDGSPFDLASVWATQRVVLVFYMGHWCPHCQKQLGELNDHQKDFAELGVTTVAVSTDSPDDAAALKEKLGLTFELYSDTDLATITKWGVEDYDAQIAKPATFIIQPGGAITFRKVGTSQTDRPTVDELLAALRK